MFATSYMKIEGKLYTFLETIHVSIFLPNIPRTDLYIHILSLIYNVHQIYRWRIVGAIKIKYIKTSKI